MVSTAATITTFTTTTTTTTIDTVNVLKAKVNQSFEPTKLSQNVYVPGIGFTSSKCDSSFILVRTYFI